MISAKVAGGFTPNKGDIVSVSRRSDNNGKDWYYVAFEQERQDIIFSGDNYTTSAGKQVSRFMGSYFVQRAYKTKAHLLPA